MKDKSASPPGANGSKPLASSSSGLSLIPAGFIVDVEAFKRAALKKQLLSAKAIAEKSGVAEERVSLLFRGQRLSLKTLLKIAKALDLDWPEGVLVKREAVSA